MKGDFYYRRIDLGAWHKAFPADIKQNFALAVVFNRNAYRTRFTA